MALTSERLTPEMGQVTQGFPVAAAAKCIKGGLIVLDSGYAKPGETATDLIAVGRCEETVDNTLGDAGDKTVTVKRGIFRYANSADTDEITQAEVETDCYIVDDETVAKTSGSDTRSVAGKVKAVDALGVFVAVGL